MKVKYQIGEAGETGKAGEVGKIGEAGAAAGIGGNSEKHVNLNLHLHLSLPLCFSSLLSFRATKESRNSHRLTISLSHCLVFPDKTIT